MEERTYKGSKMGRLKAMAAVGILSLGMLGAPGMEKDAYAAGAAGTYTIASESNQTMVYKPSKERLSRIQKGIENFEQQRKDLGIKENNSNDFRNSLRIDNPKSEYYNPNYENDVKNTLKKSNLQTKGNVRVGEIDNDRGRW